MRQRAKRLNLRERVTLALVAIVSLFVSVQGLLAYWSLEEQEDDLADEWVLAEARRLAARAEQGELGASAPAELYTPTSTLSAWLLDGSGTAIPGPVPGHLRALPEGTHRARHADAELHVVVLTTSRGRLYVQYDASSNEAKVDQFGIYLLGLVMLCVLLALAVSRRIAAVVVAPIERLTRQLGGWVPDTVMDQAATSDEEARLLDAFRHVQSRFEEAVAREREFVANVRHEIRTPLAALRTDLEMLALTDRAEPNRDARLQRALATTDAITAALESARVLSHRRKVAPQAVDLAQCVDDAWASLRTHADGARLRFVNAVAPATIVHADRHALLTILRNLIRNAAEHAAPARCVVRYSDHAVEVADDGPGIAPEDLPFVFERYYRGRLRDSPGVEAADRGIGLAIARQVADLNGWSLQAHSEPGQGARFVLRLH